MNERINQVYLERLTYLHEVNIPMPAFKKT